MADLASVDRVLAVTRQSFRAPPEARERVRAGLAASERQPGDAGTATGAGEGPKLAAVTGVARSTAALLSGLTFVAGFWLGGARREREPAASGEAAALVVPAAPTVALPVAVPASVPSRGASAEDSTAPEPRTPVVSGAASKNEGLPRAERRLPEGARRVVRATRARAAPLDGTPGVGSQVARERRARTSDEELALLRRAEHSIRSGHPELALSLLDELEQRYPETRLDEERTAARLMARCARGDVDASAKAAQFLQSSPLSVYSERVRALCAIEIVGDAPDGTDNAGH